MEGREGCWGDRISFLASTLFFLKRTGERGFFDITPRRHRRRHRRGCRRSRPNKLLLYRSGIFDIILPLSLHLLLPVRFESDKRREGGKSGQHAIQIPPPPLASFPDFALPPLFLSHHDTYLGRMGNYASVTLKKYIISHPPQTFMNASSSLSPPSSQKNQLCKVAHSAARCLTDRPRIKVALTPKKPVCSGHCVFLTYINSSVAVGKIFYPSPEEVPTVTSNEMRQGHSSVQWKKRPRKTTQSDSYLTRRVGRERERGRERD